MPAIAKVILGLVVLVNIVIGVGLFGTRPQAGPSFDPNATPVEDLPAAAEALVAPFTYTNYFGVSGSGFENDLRFMKAKASTPSEEKAIRATAKRFLGDSAVIERNVRNNAIWVLVGLLIAPLGLALVGIGLPKNGTLLTLLGGAAVAMPQHEQLLLCLIPTAIGWLALLVVHAKRRPLGRS